MLPKLPVSDSALNRLIGELESFPNVNRVVADTRWMARLDETLVAGERWVLALAGAMVLGAILALANTLHLAIDARREEILVVRVIGGSPAFVRRPLFVYRAVFWCRRWGVSSAHAVGFEASGSQGRLMPCSYCMTVPGQLQGPGFEYPLALTVLGAMIGWLASWAATERYFRRLEAR